MKIKIRKGTHYPYLIPIAFPYYVKADDINYREARFMFTDSCMFDLHDEDQHDVNKLFGFSIGHHHKRSSFRFGWRPILKNNTIEICAYEYHDGVRQKTMPIHEVKLNKQYQFRISYLPHIDRTHYLISDVETHDFISDKKSYSFANDFVLKKKSGLGYTLGVYFGGNEKAPQNITIYKK